MTNPVLEAEGVVAGYGAVEILHGVDVVVHEAEIVAIIGPNGAGKSTLLKAVFGLLKVDPGRVALMGHQCTNKRPDQLVLDGLGYVPQVDNVFPSMTINENLEMGAYVLSGSSKDRYDRVYEMFPDLAGRRSQLAGRLSGGQRQMLALARALMLDPKVLLLDEPSASLSPKMVGVIFERIAAINESGTAILLVEQNAKEALSVSDRAYVLATGENRIEGEAASLLENEDVGKLYLGN